MKRGVLAIAAAAFVVSSGDARSQPVPRHPTPPQPHAPSAPLSDAGDLRMRFGVERARLLGHSQDADERLRGLERAAALGTREAIAFLAEQLDLTALTRTDARARIAIARGLAQHTDQLAARAALIQLLDIATPRPSAQKPETLDPAYAPRIEIARGIAALALAQSGEAHAVDALVAMARSPAAAGGPAAIEALSAHPPAGSTTWAKPVTPAVASLAARLGDLRALGTLLEAAQSKALGDEPTRAAAIEALAALGDGRVIPIAKGALAEDEPRVRVAATRALVALGAAEGPAAVERILSDDATAIAGIDLASSAHSAGVVHALAARAAIAADRGVRSAAVAALGRDPTSDGTEALVALMADPFLRADAADALARSPSARAMAAIEHLGESAESRRLAARAYVVRASARGERSAAMDRVVDALGRSTDDRDRAVAVFVRIALYGEDALRFLDDPSPFVRRAAAMAAPDEPRVNDALLARWAGEDDPATRAVLSLGLRGGDPSAAVPTHALAACTRGGGSDAALCTLALAARGSETESGEIETLLASPDPILRVHAARGLARSADPTRGGRLAAAYAYEPDPLVRRAVFAELASIPSGAPSLADAIALAARFDPDPLVRFLASRLVQGRGATARDETDVAWIHLVDADGSPPRAGATGAVVRADGVAVPIAFDADGDALVPGIPPGSARLVLAPRLDAAYGGAR